MEIGCRFPMMSIPNSECLYLPEREIKFILRDGSSQYIVIVILLPIYSFTQQSPAIQPQHYQAHLSSINYHTWGREASPDHSHHTHTRQDTRPSSYSASCSKATSFLILVQFGFLDAWTVGEGLRNASFISFIFLRLNSKVPFSPRPKISQMYYFVDSSLLEEMSPKMRKNPGSRAGLRVICSSIASCLIFFSSSRDLFKIPPRGLAYLLWLTIQFNIISSRLPRVDDVDSTVLLFPQLRTEMDQPHLPAIILICDLAFG